MRANPRKEILTVKDGPVDQECNPNRAGIVWLVVRRQKAEGGAFELSPSEPLGDTGEDGHLILGWLLLLNETWLGCHWQTPHLRVSERVDNIIHSRFSAS